MSPVAPLVQNPLTAERDSRNRAALLELFPALRTAGHDRILALRPFLRRTPECWFDRAAHSWLSEWLEVRDAGDRRLLQDYESAESRYQEMSRILGSLGEAVNPRYLQAARDVGEQNVQDWAAGGFGRDHTPGAHVAEPFWAA